MQHIHRLTHSAIAGGATLLFSICLIPLPAPGAPREKRAEQTVVRWDEQRPGCTASRSDDGKYRYGLWADGLGITLSVDSQELEKAHRRHEPFFAIFLHIRYRGQDQLAIDPATFSLEFVTHFKVTQPALDPDRFALKVQNDADELDYQTAREIEKHPQQKAAKEAYARAFQKDASELVEFVGRNSLRPARLDPANSEASGWALFSTKSRWIGNWKKQEEFLLIIPLGGKSYEFPFKLPPKPGELMLRKRE
jgi:hypothetical protein